MYDCIIQIDDKGYFKEIEENPENLGRGTYPSLNLYVGSGIKKNKIITTKNKDEAKVAEGSMNLRSYVEQVIKNMEDINCFKVIKIRNW